ncbi:site-specific integrase [Delftia sp. BR1]|nr:site-specific integrase [Delftia sp. BR1]
MPLRTAHSILQIPIAEGPPGVSLPFLFLQEGEVSLLALAWARHRMLNAGSGTASIAKAVSAIGRFYDFYVLEHEATPLAPEQLRLLLKQFYEARRFGLPSLGWKAVKVPTAANDVRAVSDFTQWCADNFGHVSANPQETILVSSMSLAEQKAHELKLEARKNWDMLYHLTPTTQEGQGVVTQRGFRPGRGKARRSAGDLKHFPPDKVWPMLTGATSLRSKLYLLLLFFGGLRISEPLHLFAVDVSIRTDGVARVVLGHPQDGAFEWVGREGQKHRGNRAGFLQYRYGLGPRNLLPENHPLHAGWKGMMADDGKRSESVVHWLREDAGRIFAKLHAEYIRTVRAKLPDAHPYYFVNEKDGEAYGQPLKLSNVAKTFTRQAQRVGLSSKTPGVNPHGARHFFGFYCASVLRLPLETTQRLMHHQSAMSTSVYYALSADAVRKELLEAQSRRELDLPEFLTAPAALQVINLSKA